MTRYSRQTILQEIGEDGQRALGRSRVVIVGCGALGTVVANNLTRAGVGRIVVIDRDFVELSNLQRQILFDEGDVGAPKAIAAVEKLRRINSEIEIEAVFDDFNFGNAERITDGADLVLDGTDNLHTRFLVNDLCVRDGVPWIYTGAVGTAGMTMNILPGTTPCLRCFVPEPPEPGSLPTCETLGVLNTIPTIVASIESTEALKILLGKHEWIEGKSLLTTYDAWSGAFDRLLLERDAACPCCGERTFPFLTEAKEGAAVALCGRNAVQLAPASKANISFPVLAERLGNAGDVTWNEFMLTLKAEGREISIFKDGRAIVKGTDDPHVATSLYARYVGI